MRPTVNSDFLSMADNAQRTAIGPASQPAPFVPIVSSGIGIQPVLDEFGSESENSALAHFNNEVNKQLMVNERIPNQDETLKGIQRILRQTVDTNENPEVAGIQVDVPDE